MIPGCLVFKFLLDKIKVMNYNEVTVIDRFLARTLLRFIPESVTPNQVTGLRFVLTPVVFWLLYKEYYFWGFVLFLFNMLTDAIDGAMARTRNQITDLGKIIDPLADKLAIGSVAILLLFRFLNHWLAWAVVLLDVAIMLVGAFEKYILGRTIQAEIFGKLKLISQVIALAVLLIFVLTQISFFLFLTKVVLWLAIILATISLFRPHSI